MLTEQKKLRIAVRVVDSMSMTEAGEFFQISRSRAHQITNEQLPNIFFTEELFDEDGVKRDIDSLRKIWHSKRVLK